MHLMPFFGAAMDVAFLGERFDMHHALGTVLIIAGVTIASRKWAG
jgi:drug/metabolite transporter (DMT)-like permease